MLNELKKKTVNLDQGNVVYKPLTNEHFNQFDQNLTKMSEISEKLMKIDKKATFRSKIVGYGFASVILAELGIISVGTFSILSWDIMEPISYLMLLGNYTMGFGWYVMFIT